MLELFSQKEIIPYLQTLSDQSRVRLYEHEVACRAVFRALPSACRIQVFHLLGRTVTGGDEHFALLVKLNICTRSSQQHGQYELHPIFLGGIRDALTKTATSVATVQVKNSRVEEAEEWARSQWDDVLHFLVRSEDSHAATVKRPRMSSATPDLRDEIRQALIDLQFYDKRITSSGYEYILKDVFEEVWILLQYFLSKCEDPSTLLALLFSLSFKNPGDEVTTTLPIASKVLVPLGLLFPSGSNNKFLVTSLGVFALLGPSKQRKLFGDRKFGLANMRIIVETTFKVYCYTTSDMHTSMLQLFCQLEARLPNLIVAMITRDSVAKAFQKGISAQQILAFLDQNADPITHKHRVKSVPDNVSDQITLWKKETSRLSLLCSGTLIECTNTSRQREVFQETLRGLGDQVLWTNQKSKVFAKDPTDPNSGIKDVLLNIKTKLGI